MIKELLNQFQNGVYIEAEVDEQTKQNLLEYCAKHNIPTNDDYHCTLIYSKKPFEGEIEKVDVSSIKCPVENFVRFDNPEEDIYALTLKLDCPAMKEIHQNYMYDYDFIYDYDEYIPHITLSYKAKDIDYKNLPLPDFNIGFSKINIEGLDENWADNKN